MASLVYLRRLQSVLPLTAPGSLCSAHRIFLTCLILATKYVNDICPENNDWVRYSVVPFYGTSGFTISEINAMERQFLCLFEWDFRIDLDDLCDEVRSLLSSNDL
jgi:G1/S-specific cyclin PLC1